MKLMRTPDRLDRPRRTDAGRRHRSRCRGRDGSRTCPSGAGARRVAMDRPARQGPGRLVHAAMGRLGVHTAASALVASDRRPVAGIDVPASTYRTGVRAIRRSRSCRSTRRMRSCTSRSGHANRDAASLARTSSCPGPSCWTTSPTGDRDCGSGFARTRSVNGSLASAEAMADTIDRVTVALLFAGLRERVR